MSADTAVKSLAILTAIPVILMALWADYFGRALERIAKENPHYDPLPELYKIRLAGVCGIFFQLGIYLGTYEVRQEAPVVSNIVFVLAVLAQSWIQGSVERKVRKPSPSLKPTPLDQAPDPAQLDGEADSAGFERDDQGPIKFPIRPASDLSPQGRGREPGPPTEMEVALRAFFWATLGGALYLAGFALPVVIVGSLSRFLGFSQPTMAAIMVVAAIVGMLGGVVINFALGALYLRRMLPTREMAASTFRDGIEACFSKAELPVPALWVIETGRKREATAMVAGFAWGRGIFRPGMFLSRALIEALTEPEARSVVLHEVAHLKLGHLRKRMLYSVGLVATLTAVATSCVFLANVWLAGSELRGMVGIAAAAGAFALTFRLLGSQSRAHELGADAYAVAELGADYEDLISALNKLDHVNASSAIPMPFSGGGMSGHPPTVRRVEALRARFGTPKTTPSDDTDSDQDRRAA